MTSTSPPSDAGQSLGSASTAVCDAGASGGGLRSLDASTRRMVADGTLVDADEFTHRLGMSAAKLDRDLEAGSLFCLQLDGRRLLPAVYLEPDLDRRTLRAVNRGRCTHGRG